MELKKVILILFLFLFISCKTVKYIKTDLPEYNVYYSARPIINEVSEKSMAELMRYAMELEICLNNFDMFYKDLREKNKVAK